VLALRKPHCSFRPERPGVDIGRYQLEVINIKPVKEHNTLGVRTVYSAPGFCARHAFDRRLRAGGSGEPFAGPDPFE